MADNEPIDQEQPQDESSVIRTLRQQVKDLQSELKGRPGDVDIEAEVAKRVERRDTVRELLGAQGFSPKMADLVLKNVEGDITEDSVKNFLSSVGLEAGVNEPEKPNPQPVSSVADLASQVASASAKDPVKDQVLDSVLNAKNRSEIDAIMRQAGLAQ